MKIKWCMVPEIWSVTEFFVILGHFLPFYPTNNPKNQNFEKMKKTPGDIIILHTCIKNHDQCYTIPEIWHMTDVIYISYFGPFSAILPPKSPKKQNFKKWKKTPGDIIILQMCTKNYDHMMYGSWDMVWDGWMDQKTDRKTDM